MLPKTYTRPLTGSPLRGRSTPGPPPLSTVTRPGQPAMIRPPMNAIELAKAFDPKSYEDRIHRFWMDNRLFAPRPNGGGRTFVIVIPPPNVTGILHMGHGLNNSLQDIEVRYHRMLGDETLWVPGSDHAGIATQHVVEKALKKRGTGRREIGREKFVEETWKVTHEHHDIIVSQLKRLGSSCDWERERFTLDEGLSAAVREVFVSLYEKGLVYRGTYLVNWCTSCRTAISDDEVEHEERHGKMYRYRYPLADGSGSVTIATTRPESMLGDTGVAVHPDDPRYAHLVGKSLVLPLVGRSLPIVADPAVDPAFGTGAVKVTPGHDPVDYETGRRHGLEIINILTPDGKLNDNVPEPYRGLTVAKARAKVVEDLEPRPASSRAKQDHVHQVGHCYRCRTVIEPFLSEQWFVKMRPLADRGLAAWQEGKLRFFPQRWENTYAHWMRTIRDWCISRQLWWGHRIPAWYCADCGKPTVARTDPTACAHCGSTKIEQDPDVLDTWFSSALWPFSTLGWPGKTADLARYFPTTTLITAYEIIFFWVARMIMMGLEFMGEVPFRDIFITGLVRDKQGRKMSKSLGNGVDPLEVIDEYGADALKFTMAFLAAQGQDVLFDKESVKLGSRFANKIWNASRYLLLNLEGRTLLDPAAVRLSEVDRWIRHRLNRAAAAARDALEGYRFNEAALAVYEFFWNDFCDWYIEAAKLPLTTGRRGGEGPGDHPARRDPGGVAAPRAPVPAADHRGDLAEAARPGQAGPARGRCRPLHHDPAVPRGRRRPRGRGRRRRVLRAPGARARRADHPQRVHDPARREDRRDRGRRRGAPRHLRGPPGPRGPPRRHEDPRLPA